MKSLKENLLVQISVTSFAIIVVIALVISFALSAQLGRNIELLTEHGSAMMAGTMIEPSASYSIPSLTNTVGELRLMTFLAMGSGFLFLNLGLVYIVRRGWQTIKRQQTALQQVNRRMDATNSQLKMANDDLRDTQEKLVRSERLAAIGELSAAVAHELRNPLGGLSLGADFVKMKIVSGGVASASPLLVPTLTQMSNDVLRANSIITDLLAYARVETTVPSSVDVESLIEQVVSHIELSEDVVVVKEIEEGMRPIYVQVDPIIRATMNVIQNASDAMPNGGTITIRANNRSDMAHIEISDTGTGIPADVIENIFEPLVSTKTKGIGLELPIVREAIRRNGGSIVVISEEGKGATFTIQLPVEPVHEVESGYQAIDLVDKNTVELVLRDVQMPGINGVGTFREIKKVSPESVTVMMTGFAVGNLVEEAVRDGVYTVMYKPFGAVEAIDMVDSIVGPTSFTLQLSRN